MKTTSPPARSTTTAMQERQSAPTTSRDFTPIGGKGEGGIEQLSAGLREKVLQSREMLHKLFCAATPEWKKRSEPGSYLDTCSRIDQLLLEVLSLTRTIPSRYGTSRET